MTNETIHWRELEGRLSAIRELYCDFDPAEYKTPWLEARVKFGSLSENLRHWYHLRDVQFPS